MAALWADPFTQYGGDESKMLDGPYAQVDTNGWTLSQTRARTGAWSLRFLLNSFVAAAVVRRVFGGPKTTVGSGLAVWMDSLPTENDRFILMQFRDAANAEQVTFYVQSTGTIEVKRAGVSLGVTLVPVIRAAAWNHVEGKVTIDNSAGAVELRCDQVTRLNLTGIDTQATANAETSQMVAGMTITFALGIINIPVYYSDWFSWDDQGSYNNDFIGDKKCFYLAPNEDTAQQDWFSQPSSLPSYSVLDETPPDDADYLYTPETTAKTEVGCESLPGNAVAVSAVFAVMRAWKDDAGTCDLNPNIKSGANYGVSPAQPATTTPQYYQGVFETDPVSGVPFTPDEVNSLLLVLERTA